MSYYLKIPHFGDFFSNVFHYTFGGGKKINYHDSNDSL